MTMPITMAMCVYDTDADNLPIIVVYDTDSNDNYHGKHDNDVHHDGGSDSENHGKDGDNYDTPSDNYHDTHSS